MWRWEPGRLETVEPLMGVRGTSGGRVRGGGRWKALAARCIGVLSVVYVVALAAAAVLLWWGGDRWWPGTILLFGPRWVLGLPFLVLVPLAAWLAPRRLFALALGAVVYLVPLMGLRVGLPRPAGESDLVILTLNVASGLGLEVPLVELVARSGADLVAIQECPHRLRDPMRLVVEGYGVHSYMSLCFLSKLPFVVGDQSGQVAAQLDTVTGASVRYDVEVAPGEILSFTNVHLPTPRSGLELIRMGRIGEGVEELTRYRRLRTEAARSARRVADGGRGANVVVGDFNAPPESRIQREVWGDLRNAWSIAGLGFGHTRFSGWIRARIDHVLVDEGWTVVRASVDPDVGSDHRAVRVRIRPRR